MAERSPLVFATVRYLPILRTTYMEFRLANVRRRWLSDGGITPAWIYQLPLNRTLRPAAKSP